MNWSAVWSVTGFVLICLSGCRPGASVSSPSLPSVPTTSTSPSVSSSPTLPEVSPTLAPPSQQESLVVRTDQAVYSRGESVLISVFNGLEVPIWYAQEVDCGLSFWFVETCEGTRIVHKQPCIWRDYQHNFTKLEPGETLTGQWTDARIENMQESKLADPGCYHILVPYVVGGDKPSGGWGSRREAARAQFGIR